MEASCSQGYCEEVTVCLHGVHEETVFYFNAGSTKPPACVTSTHIGVGKRESGTYSVPQIYGFKPEEKRQCLYRSGKKTRNEGVCAILEKVSRAHGLQAAFKDSLDYVWPKGTIDQEYHSLGLQMEKAKVARQNYLYPTQLEEDQILQIAEKEYCSTQFSIPEDFGTYRHYLRVLDRLQSSSSPGLPYCRTYSTIGELMGGEDKLLWSASRKKHIWQDVKTVIREQIEPVFSVFIKDEAHKPAKAAEGRWRLIFAAPLAHQIIGHMLFSEHHDQEIDNTFDHPSAYGMTLYHGNWMKFRRIQQHQCMSNSYDRKAWDLQSPGWVYALRKRLRKRLCRNPSKLWLRLLDWYYQTSYFTSKIMLSDGQTYVQLIDGIMKSGLVSTISDNSCAQFFEHVLASIRLAKEKEISLFVNPIFAVGDDTLQPQEDFEDDYIRLLQQAGCVIKEGHKSLEEPEFVGFTFPKRGPVPCYLAKHMSNVINYSRQDVIREWCAGGSSSCIISRRHTGGYLML